VLLVAVGVGKGAVEAGRSHESGTVGRVVVHGGLRRRRALGKRRGQRRARDLHYVSGRALGEGRGQAAGMGGWAGAMGGRVSVEPAAIGSGERCDLDGVIAE
jgi:hypothetical protein